MADRETIDSYLTVRSVANIEFTEQRSRFISFSVPVSDIEQVKSFLDKIKKDYYDARHICYAYVLGADRTDWRANDNGEPSGTAGQPILGQINSAGLTDILIAVVRYFGGIKLGTSGLIEAYRKAAADVIAASTVVTAYVTASVELLYGYDSMNVVMRAVKDLELNITTQEYGSFTDVSNSRMFECRAVLSARRTSTDKLIARMNAIIETQAEPRLACSYIE